jgi:thymidylate synthase ThyX
VKVEDIDKMREAMGTAPEAQPKRSDDVFYGVQGIIVELVDYPRNPYKAIYEMVTATWGGRDRWRKRWNNATVDGRIQAVIAALRGETLPQCLEAGTFTFRISGLSRSSFDQLARTRQSAIGSVGMRDNNWLDAALRLPSDLAKHDTIEEIQLFDNIKKWWKGTKDLYEQIVQHGQHSWQSARSILPMGTCWRFVWSLNYRALKDMLAKRLMFCEQYDTVATAWLIRQQVEFQFPLLAAYLRPACDFAKTCVYHKTYALSQVFGCLFAPCSRWPPGEEIYATFKNESASNPDEIMRDLNVLIYKPSEWDGIVERAKRNERTFFEGKE